MNIKEMEKLKKDSRESVAEATAASTPEPVAEAPVEHTYTYEEAMAEACAAGRQYRNDVDTGFLRHSQAEAEAASYAEHLAAQSSGVDSGVLYQKIKQGLWNGRC